MLTYEAVSTASPEACWALLARPGRWHEWAPQLRGAWRLGEPEVRQGARGAARLLGVIPVPATITAVDPAPPRRSWRWRVGPVEFDHRVSPHDDGGALVGVDLMAAAPLETVLAVTYGPVVQLLVRNLAHVAARSGGTG